MALDETALQAILEAADGTIYRDLVLVAVRTGLRRGELLGLRWTDVDLARGQLTVRHSLERIKGQGLVLTDLKAEKSLRRIPLTRDVRQTLHQIKKDQAERKLILGQAYQDHNLVFCQANWDFIRPEQLSTQFKRFAREAGVPGATLHSLRHTFASMLLSRGAAPGEVQALLGHESIVTTMDTYSHILPGVLEKTIQLLDGHQVGTKKKKKSAPILSAETLVFIGWGRRIRTSDT